MKPLFRHLLTLTAALVALSLPAGAALAQDAGQSGTAAEVKAMLEKAVAVLKADKARALEMFNKGEGGFKDRDLYPFCANAGDGVFTAHPKLIGQKLGDLKKAGFGFGAELMKTAQEGKVNEVAYSFPRPGSDAPVPKVTYVQKVGDQVVGVGYYK